MSIEPQEPDISSDPLSHVRNRIICGDILDTMQTIPDASVDLVVTSPPYNLRNSSGNGMKDGRGGKWSGAELINGYAGYNDNMPHEQYVQWQRQCLAEMVRVIPDDGAIFYNHKWRVQRGLLQDRQDIVAGFPVRQIIIWQRKGGINFNPGSSDAAFCHATATSILDVLGEQSVGKVISTWDDLGVKGCLNAERSLVVAEFTKLRANLAAMGTHKSELEDNMVFTAFVQEFERRLG